MNNGRYVFAQLIDFLPQRVLTGSSRNIKATCMSSILRVEINYFAWFLAD